MTKQSKSDPSAVVHIVDDSTDMLELIEAQVESIGLKAKLYQEGKDLIETLTSDTHGCIVLDLRMPGRGGLALLESFSGLEKKMPIIIFSGFLDVTIAIRAMKVGCFAVIEKGASMEFLLDAIRQAIAVDRERHSAKLAQAAVESRQLSLTQRENEVMRLILEGKRNKEIAFELGICTGTVEIHRSRVMKKMDANSVAHLVRMVFDRAS